MKTISIKGALVAGWKAFRANLALFITFGLTFLGIWAVEQVGTFIAGHAGVLKPAILLSVTVAARVAQLWVQLGLLRVALKTVDGHLASVDDLFPLGGAQDFFSFLLAAVLYGLMVGFGLALLVVPGVILAVRYGLWGLVVVDQHADPLEAFKRSAVVTEGVRWELLVFGLALAGVNMVGALALGVGLLATIPVTAVAAARVYRQLVARAEAKAPSVTLATGERPAEVH